VTAHPEIRQDPVHPVDHVNPKKSLEVTEVLGDKENPLVIGQVTGRVGILVKSDQPAIRTQPGEYRPGMTSAPEGAVDIGPVGSDIQPRDGFLQKYRDMISIIQ